MVKGGKRYFAMGNDGKWFAHPDCSENESRPLETCTTTGAMLREVKTLLPEDLHLEPYPKWKVHQQSREYPFSCHDNKNVLKNNISVFSNGVGRRKYPHNLGQSKSNFSLCHNSDERCSEGPRGSFSTYQTDFTSVEAINVPNRTRRFPRNHKLRSAEAIVEQAGEQFMWFGQDKSNIPETLEVLGIANRSAPSKS
ncbi:hypothetical protein XENORESO_016448 [Xenotaenia resolanae]|uniref:Domain of unknown function with conserved HDNR motif domain-containing protein n=1 Tax=Xenotaenia resolanae TaxID=208358 RepID=A0ABV0XAA3_9TELE